MKINSSLYYLSITIVALSCQKFSEGVVHEIPFPNHDPVLSTTLIVKDIDQKLRVNVSSTASVIDTSGPQPISNAVITITDPQGSILYTLTQDDYREDKEIYRQNLNSDFGTITEELTLTVDAPDFDLITSSTFMPPKPILDYTYEPFADTILEAWSEENIIRDRFTLNLYNNPGIKDFYMIHIETLYVEIETGDTQIDSQWLDFNLDPRIVYNSLLNGALISDESNISNQTALSEIILLAPSSKSTEKYDITKRIRIESLTESTARYYMDVNENESGGISDLFAEPSLIFSNISSGFGCFGMVSELVVEVE